MTTTVTAPSVRTTPKSGTGTHLWRTGAVAGVAASVATFGFAVLAEAIDVPLTVGGKSIPLVGFARLTLIASIVGTLLAMVLSHIVAAAIVIPSLPTRLTD